MARLDQKTDQVTLDDTFHGPGSPVPGISFDGTGLSDSGKALVHGTLSGQ